MATDVCGNAATCTTTIVVEDTTPPVVLADNVTVSVQCEGDAVPPVPPPALDACQGPIAPVMQPVMNMTPGSILVSQDWTNIGLITADNNWSGVPGFIGYRGDALTNSTGVNPQTVTADGSATPVSVIANQANPNTLTTGGLAEFHIANPVVALQSSTTADAPHLVIQLNTTGMAGINVSYNLRDIDGSADNAVTPIALQYRIGNAGPYINLPAGFVADATTGPSLATLVTAVSAMLPAAADNQSQVFVRIITSDAASNDEWVGIDDILVTANGTLTCGGTRKYSYTYTDCANSHEHMDVYIQC